MTDGRVYTMEDEIDVLHEDLGRARRALWSLERAEPDGRIANEGIYRHTLRVAREKVATLEREAFTHGDDLAEAYAEKIAAAEGFQT